MRPPRAAPRASMRRSSAPRGLIEGSTDADAVEPPSESPTRLEAAYALLSDADGDPWRPIAGGTDLMVQITGEIGEPPAAASSTSGRLDELRGIARRGRRARPRRADAPTPISAGRRSSPSSCRHWSTPRRRSARPRSRTAARSAATSSTPRPPATRCHSCWRSTRRSCLAAAAGERTVPASDFWPSYRRRRAGTTSCSSASGSRSRRTDRCASARSARAARRPSPRS